MFHQGRQHTICKDIRKIKKQLQGVPVSKASAIISKEWKKVKASNKKMKKYRDLYEEEKIQHEEALQRYQEDHMDEMEIINLHKRCNKKVMKVPQPKKASDSGNEKKAATKPTQPKKASGTDNEKKPATQTIHPEKAPKSPEFFDSWKEDEKEERLPLLWVKEEVQSFFDLRKDSENLTIKKKVEKVVFMGGFYKD